MKRVFPDPTQVYRPGPAYQCSFSSLPLELVENICQFLMLEETCATLQTHRNIYYPARANDPFWQRFFLKHFSFPRIVPQGSWLNECETQYRSMYNIIAGRCTVNEFKPSGDDIACFVRDEKGRFIVAFTNGQMSVCDPETNKQDELGNWGVPRKMAYLDGLCAVQYYDNKVLVWELATKEITFSFEPKDNEFKETIHRMDFIDGRLVVGVAVTIPLFSENIQGNEPTYVINIFDLKSNSEPIICPLKDSPVAIDLCGKTLACVFPRATRYLGDQNIAIFDLEANVCRGRVTSALAKRPAAALLEVWIVSEKVALTLSGEKSFIRKIDVRNAQLSHPYYLWESPGIPDGFQWGKEGSLPYSTNEISFLFSKCLPKQFVHWDPRRQGTVPPGSEGASFNNFLPQRVSSTGDYVFDQRKFSFLNEYRKVIFSLDFTASKEEILGQIVKRLEAGDETSLNYARIYLKRMQQPVQDAIWSIYDSLVNQQEVMDLDCLKESIQHYLMSISSE
jgi:hypothetical protein